MILDSQSTDYELLTQGGGKALGLYRLTHWGLRVPKWAVISCKEYVRAQMSGDLAHGAELLRPILVQLLKDRGWEQSYLAVRSSGLQEDSVASSAAGLYETVLNVRGIDSLVSALVRCWQSATASRVANPAPMAVVIQEMLDPLAAGVAFSRDPRRPWENDRVLVSSVRGLGDALVSGEIDADLFEITLGDSDRVKSTLAELKKEKRRLSTGQTGWRDLDPSLQGRPSLETPMVLEIARATRVIEQRLGHPADVEWAIEGEQLYWLQARPISALPVAAVFDAKINGEWPTLWDNSNIVESYSGVTTPLTYSHAVRAYHRVYKQFCEVMGVPARQIAEHDRIFRTMLGLIRGRIYYNLAHWYEMLHLFPASRMNAQFMETMMGVSKQWGGPVAKLFDFGQRSRRVGTFAKLKLLVRSVVMLARAPALNRKFEEQVGAEFRRANAIPFADLPLSELCRLYEELVERIVGRWKAPIINDTRCMIFFGLLRKLTQKWVIADPGIQNDLLCGETGIESTEPAKRMMRMAAKLREGGLISSEEVSAWSKKDPANALGDLYTDPRLASVAAAFKGFLDKYGYRSPNELKLEEPDLVDDPSFAVSMIQGYVRAGQTDVAGMELREKEIRHQAESRIRAKVSGPRLWFYNWVLRNARAAIKDRESLRLMRTQTFGMLKRLFRAMGGHLHAMGSLKSPGDVFYITVEELLAFQEGRAVSRDLASIAELRKQEFAEYRKSADPPERFLARGAVGILLRYPSLITAPESEQSLADSTPLAPNCLRGTACCPGIVVGRVRVARTIQDAAGLDQEILVAEKTDPGWVPLFPLCQALLVERGSLLSHSAVVAREFGVPTIVGIGGGLMTRLRTGMKVKMDGSTGLIEILEEEAHSE